MNALRSEAPIAALVPLLPPVPCAADAVRSLKLRASVERAMRRAKAREAAPDAPLERARRAQRLEARARDLAREEKWGAAAHAQLRAARLEPDNARRWHQAARWQREDGDPFGAVETLRRALQRAGENSALQESLAGALLECEEFAACADICRALLAAEPRHHAALEMLATTLLHEGRVNEALEGFRVLLVISPRDPLHRLKLAALLHLQGHLGAASREFERVAALSPSPPWAREAQDSIEQLDRLQIEGVMLCALRPDARGEAFRELAQRDLDAALAQHDFYLSEAGRETLRHLLRDGRPMPETPSAAPRIH